jgi:hypothetical protein
MEATALDILNIISLGAIAGTATALFIGYLAGIRDHEWGRVPAKDQRTMILLILACSSTFIAVLSLYLFQYLTGA